MQGQRSFDHQQRGTSQTLPQRSQVGSSRWTLWRSFGTVGTWRTDAAMLEGCPPRSASGVSRCHPCLAVQTLSGEETWLWEKESWEEGGIVQSSSCFVVFTWNSSCSFFSIHSVTWQNVTSLSPSLGRTCRSNLGGTQKLYLQRS